MPESNQRVDLMMEEGLVEEVQKLKEMGCDSTMVSMQGWDIRKSFLTWKGSVPWMKLSTRSKGTPVISPKDRLPGSKGNGMCLLHKPDYDYDETKIREAVLPYYI